MSAATPIAADLAQVLGEIGALVDGAPSPSAATLDRVAALLEGFVERHADALDFDAFPLPTAPGEALCSYDLTDEGAAPSLRINAIRGGVDSAVHDHGTWAVIVAVRGRERNRIHVRAHGADPGAPPVFQREACVAPGQPLVLQPGVFHSIHTDIGAPALQLHLYGQAPEGLQRQVLDAAAQALVPLLGDGGAT